MITQGCSAAMQGVALPSLSGPVAGTFGLALSLLGLLITRGFLRGSGTGSRRMTGFGRSDAQAAQYVVAKQLGFQPLFNLSKILEAGIVRNVGKMFVLLSSSDI